MTDQPPAEFSAIQEVYAALQKLEPDAQSRVMNYIAGVLNLTMFKGGSKGRPAEAVTGAGKNSAAEGGNDATFSSFAELYDAAQPDTDARKALVAGYWLQECQGGESFDSQSAHKELKHLGHPQTNITTSLSILKAQKPSLVLQLKKSGTSKQARKTYKVTVAGVTAVKDMIEAVANNG